MMQDAGETRRGRPVIDAGARADLVARVWAYLEQHRLTDLAFSQMCGARALVHRLRCGYGIAPAVAERIEAALRETNPPRNPAYPVTGMTRARVREIMGEEAAKFGLGFDNLKGRFPSDRILGAVVLACHRRGVPRTAMSAVLGRHERFAWTVLDYETGGKPRPTCGRAAAALRGWEVRRAA
jgi:hypothetical protein